MNVWLSIEGDDPVEGFAELSNWLGQEPDLRGLVAYAAAAPAPGELGTLADVLVAAVGGGGAVSVLAASLRTFLTLPRRSDISIVVTNPDGRRIEIDARRVGDVEALLRQVTGEVE